MFRRTLNYIKPITLMLLFLPLASYGADNPLESGAQWFLDLITGPVARTVAVIAIILLGYGLTTGRLDKRVALTIIGGILLIFGGAWFVDEFVGEIS